MEQLARNTPVPERRPPKFAPVIHEVAAISRSITLAAGLGAGTPSKRPELSPRRQPGSQRNSLILNAANPDHQGGGSNQQFFMPPRITTDGNLGPCP